MWSSIVAVVIVVVVPIVDIVVAVVLMAAFIARKLNALRTLFRIDDIYL